MPASPPGPICPQGTGSLFSTPTKSGTRVSRTADGKTLNPTKDQLFFPAVNQKEGSMVRSREGNITRKGRGALNSITYVRAMIPIRENKSFLKKLMPSLSSPILREWSTNAEGSQSTKGACNAKPPQGTAGLRPCLGPALAGRARASQQRRITLSSADSADPWG